MNKNQENETLIGIDYGSVNIGLALGISGFVQPLKVVSVKNPNTAIHEIITTALQAKADKFIIGLPLNAEGKETSQSKEIRKFGKNLKIKSKKPVEFFDEHLSSKEALKESISLGLPQKKRSSTDHIAAGIILKRYFQEKGIDYTENFLPSTHFKKL